MTIQRYMIGRLMVTSAITAAALCIPICITSVFREIPTDLLYSKEIGVILRGILPSIIYLTLPVAVGIAVTWWYETQASDNFVTALYAAHYSPVAIVKPAVVVAFVGMGLGLFFSNVIAPDGVHRLYETIFEFKHRLTPSSLEPQKFYHLDDGKSTIFFDKWLDSKRVSGIFIRETTEKREERIIVAATGEFVEVSDESLVLLRNGSLQITARGGQPDIAAFDVLLNSTGLRGTMPFKRTVGVYELGPIAFIKIFKIVKHDRRSLVRWLSEAIKRFGAPVLTMAYTLIGLGLVIRGLGTRGDRWWRLHGIFGLIAISHVAVMLAAEGGLNVDLRIAWVIVAVILIEVAIGVLLISHSTFQGAMGRFLRSRESLPGLAGISNGTGDRGGRLAPRFHREHLELEPVASDGVRRRGGQA